jgi:hypothetical protein
MSTPEKNGRLIKNISPTAQADSIKKFGLRFRPVVFNQL